MAETPAAEQDLILVAYHQGRADERARIRDEVTRTWAHYDYVSKDGLLNLLEPADPASPDLLGCAT